MMIIRSRWTEGSGGIGTASELDAAAAAEATWAVRFIRHCRCLALYCDNLKYQKVLFELISVSFRR